MTILIVIVLLALYLLFAAESKRTDKDTTKGGLYLALGGAGAAKIRVDEATFCAIKNGDKKHDIRLNKGWVKMLEDKEKVKFINKKSGDDIDVTITKKEDFPSLDHLSKKVNKRALQDETFPGEDYVEKVNGFYTCDQQNEHGLSFLTFKV